MIARHVLWDTIGLPILARLYIRAKDIGKLPGYYRWQFQTKLQQAAELIRWAADLAAGTGKRVWIVADGFYAKRPVIKVVRSLGVVLISRLRKDATLWTLPPPLSVSQTRMGPREPTTIRRLSEQNTNLCPESLKDLSSAPLSASHTRTIPSSEPLTIHRPSGEQDALVTPLPCPRQYGALRCPEVHRWRAKGANPERSRARGFRRICRPKAELVTRW